MFQEAKQQNPGSLNVYICLAGGGSTWVRHVDEGVTPFLLRCRAVGCSCNGTGEAQSRMYPRDIPDNVEGRFEWWRPRNATDARLAAIADIDDAIKRLQARQFPNQAPGPVEREAAIVSLVQHWEKGGAFLRASAQPWRAYQSAGGAIRTEAIA